MSKKPKKGRVELERALPVPMTQEEMITKAKAMARLNQNADALTQEAKDKGAELRTEARRARADAIEIQNQIIIGAENRPVLCFERLDTERNLVEIIRADTNETVDTRPTTPEDRQLSLAPPPKGDKDTEVGG